MKNAKIHKISHYRFLDKFLKAFNNKYFHNLEVNKERSSNEAFEKKNSIFFSSFVQQVEIVSISKGLHLKYPKNEYPINAIEHNECTRE